MVTMITIFSIGFLSSMIFFGQLDNRKEKEMAKDKKKREDVRKKRQMNILKESRKNIFINKDAKDFCSIKLKSSDEYNACFNGDNVFVAFNFTHSKAPEYSQEYGYVDGQIYEFNLGNLGGSTHEVMYIEREFMKALDSGNVSIFSKTKGIMVDKIFREEVGKLFADDQVIASVSHYYLSDGCLLFVETDNLMVDPMFETVDKKESWKNSMKRFLP